MDDFKEKDALWDLLGRAPRVKASPYFARKVLSAIREEKQPRFSVAALLRWVIPAGACAALIIGWSTSTSTSSRMRLMLTSTAQPTSSPSSPPRMSRCGWKSARFSSPFS